MKKAFDIINQVSKIGGMLCNKFLFFLFYDYTRPAKLNTLTFFSSELGTLLYNHVKERKIEREYTLLINISKAVTL
jgi:hypothetical protein